MRTDARRPWLIVPTDRRYDVGAVMTLYADPENAVTVGTGIIRAEVDVGAWALQLAEHQTFVSPFLPVPVGMRFYAVEVR